MFWLCLKPGSVTSIRHDWTSPVFPSSTMPRSASPDFQESERWLKDYAKRYSADYSSMVAGALSGDGYCFGNDDGPPNYRDESTRAEFWYHIEVVSGKHLTPDHKENTYFRCAC